MYTFNTFVNEPFKESFYTTFMRNVKDYLKKKSVVF